MTVLARYDQACRALAEATAVDEVKDLLDKAEALRVYARQARNRKLETDAAEIRIRAERRMGEMIDQKRAEGLVRDGAPVRTCTPGTGSVPDRIILTDLGITGKFRHRVHLYSNMPETEFERRLARRRDLVESGASRVPLDLTTMDDKMERRAAREAALSARVRALPGKRYGVILGDPEWRFEPWSRETGMDRAADNHYPTSTLAALCARDVASIAAKDCLYALWATVPMLAEAFAVLDAHGFARFDRDPSTGFLTIDKRAGRYVSSASWTKYKPGAGIGMGHWFRVDHEILLIATRGDVPGPAQGTQARSVFDCPASAVHSQKPELVAEILESYFPTVPKIELNRRGPARPGWDAWGDEAEPWVEAAE